jgi:hypothetical protein
MLALSEVGTECRDQPTPIDASEAYVVDTCQEEVVVPAAT